MISDDLHCRRHQGLSVPVANQFYKRVNKRLKAGPDETVWTASLGHGMVAALRLRPLVGGQQLLTGLFVEPSYRCRGVALTLLQAARKDFNSAGCYLFCEPQLKQLYTAVGFEQTLKAEMPDALVGRWQAYQRKTPELIAMFYR